MNSKECLNKIEALIEYISEKCEDCNTIFQQLKESLDELEELEKQKLEIKRLRYVLNLLVDMLDLEVKDLFGDYYLEGTNIEEKLSSKDGKLMSYIFDEYCF